MLFNWGEKSLVFHPQGARAMEMFWVGGVEYVGWEIMLEGVREHENHLKMKRGWG